MFRALTLSFLLIAALFSVAAESHAAIGNIGVTGITNTQAILSYDAPDDGTCQLKVSENARFTPLVNDLDPAKFSGANLDNRSGNVFNGRVRQFVIGKRAADLAANSLRYSRALQAYTVHYYQLTCPSTGDVAAGQFQTTTIPLGQTYTDTPPVDLTNPGEYAWPALSLSDRTQTVIDPFTGALIRRVSLPQDRAYTQFTQHQPMLLARSSAWSTPAAVLANDRSSATISANNTGALFLSIENNGSYSGNFNVLHAGHQDNNYSLDWFQVTLNAKTSNSSCNGTAVDDCKILVCLTIDGVACYEGSRQFQQPLTTTLTNYTFGTKGTPIDLWQNTGVRAPNGTQAAIRQGLVTCDGSAAITQTSGDHFAAFWKTGSAIQINGVDYRISNVNSLTGATLTTACPKGSYTYYATNFGVLVTKKTTSSDTVSVQYASVTYQLGIFPFWDYSGEYNLCSTATVTGPTGNPGYNCSTINNGAVYWIDSITGESHLIALNQGAYGTLTGSCGAFDTNPFDATNPDIWYCGGNQPQNVHYFGDHSEPRNGAFPNTIEEGINLPACNSSKSPTNQPCLVFTTITGTTTMAALTAAFDADFQSDRFLNWYLAGVENGILIFRNWRSSYGSIGWTVMFDPKATANSAPNNAGCVGGGSAGCVVAALPSWKRTGARWCTQKSNDFFGVPGWTAIGPYGWSYSGDTKPGFGPYVSTVTDGTAFSTSAGVAGGRNNCPANSFGVSGQQCTTVTVDGEPRDLSPCVASASACSGAVETGLPGEIGVSAPGDYFTMNGEQMRLLLKNGNQWTFQRGFNFGGTFASSSANPQLAATCNSVPNPLSAQQPNGEFFWNFAADPHGYNLSGASLAGDPYSVNAHYFSGGGALVNGYSFDSRCPASGAGNSCYQVRTYSGITDLVTKRPSIFVQQNPSFSGKSGPAPVNYVQEHPAGPGDNASAALKQFFWDGRPFNGTSFSGSGASDGSNPATLVAGQLWKFTASQVPNLDRKFLPTFAFSGHKTLLDISGPASTITTTSSDSYKYCVANIAGECVTGSAAGDVYVNAPFVNYPYCHWAGQAGQMPDDFDLCIGNNAMVFNGLIQVGMAQTDNTGRYMRNLSTALSRNRLVTPFYHPHALANGNWIIADVNYAENVADMVVAIKVPPVPAPDSLNRGDFHPVAIRAKPPATLNAATAFAEFGYAEFGAPAKYYCTSRSEVCAVGRATSPTTIDRANPFYFETTEASKLSGTPCTSGCTIAIPGVSGRILYGRIVYRNAGGAIISTGEPFIVAVP